jgi:hypothetical protein
MYTLVCTGDPESTDDEGESFRPFENAFQDYHAK